MDSSQKSFVDEMAQAVSSDRKTQDNKFCNRLQKCFLFFRKWVIYAKNWADFHKKSD